MERVREVFNNIMNVIKKPEMRVLPGQLAFFFVISLIPLIALIGAIASKFSISLESIENNIIGVIPKEVSEILASAIRGEGLNFNIIIFLISAFLLASNGPHSMIITSNEIYKIKSRDIISRRIKAILMTIVVVFLLIFLLIVPVFGNSIINLFQEILPNKNSVKILYSIYHIFKLPVTVIFVYINIKLLYILAPDKKIEAKSTTAGAVFTTFSWIIATEVYSIYVAKFSRYDLFYGSISNILILLFWVYILSYIFVLGMAFNAGNVLDIKKNKNQ